MACTFKHVFTLGMFAVAAAFLAACGAQDQANIGTGLATPAGQLFCRINAVEGPKVVAVIDAVATAKLPPGAAPVAILATNATAAYVQSACDAAAAKLGAPSAAPVPPPAAAVALVAVTPPTS